MRTTLTVDDDLAQQLTDLARESGRPFKVVVNEALRLGLGEYGTREKTFVLQPHAGYLQPGIDDRGFNELAWDVERTPLDPSR